MVQKEGEFVKWFSELSNKDINIAGGKGASLAEMYNIKMPIPPGFVVTAQAYAHFIKKTGLAEKISSILAKLNIEDTQKLNKVSETLRELIEKTPLPEELETEIAEAYEILGSNNEQNEDASSLLKNKRQNIFVAVRSSATTEDLADASFAGQQDTYLNVHTTKELLDKVKKCMSSLFTARAIYYRTKKGFLHEKSYLSVVVQKMINAEKSGVMFSKNPTNKDDNVIIEAVWGLGEGIVSGKINPDHYSIDMDLENFKLEEISIGRKKIAMIRNSEGKTETISLSEEQSKKQVLNAYELKRLAQYALQLEEHYKKAQDIEFAIDKTGIYIVQSRPVTTLGKKSSEQQEVEGEVLLSGLGASPGISSGKVKIIYSLADLEKVQKGDVLVTEMTNPDMVVAMERAAAIVTDEGGITSHAAIVSREMGIPAVVGTNNATKKLKEGEIITIDGTSGKVIAGAGETKLVVVEPIVPTKTKIKVIVDLPSSAERAAKSHARGIGLTRLEGIIAQGGKHPMFFVKKKNMNEYISLLVNGLTAISQPFEEIWVRTSDIRSDEYRGLEGAPQEVEGNPMLGDHGIRFSLKHKEILESEIEALKRVALKNPTKTFGLMIPQLISLNELQETKKLAAEIKIPQNIKIGIMVETPAAVQLIEEFCREGISFISFGTNDLTQYTLAIDRNNEHVQHLFDETHQAVVSSIKHVIRVCKRYNVQTSICGQAGSREDMVRILLAEGIDSISVNADAARKISILIAEMEKKMPAKKQEEQQTNAEEDIEQTILKELEDTEDYSPSAQKVNQDMPPLNDAIPIESELLDETR